MSPDTDVLGIVSTMTRFVIAVTALVLLVAAAQPADVAPELKANGYFIEVGSDADPGDVSDAVAEARFQGGALSVAVLAAEPSGGATVFAENTLDAMGGIGTVFAVGPETVGWASQGDIYNREQLDSATDASLNGGSDTEVVQLFVSSLTGKSVGGTEAGGSGGFGWGWVILIVIVGGGAFLFWRASQSSKKRAADAVDRARAEVQKRLDDVANDIIDLEGEVALSEDATVREHYDAAASAYAQALDDYEKASGVPQLMAMAEELDVAIWNLDTADAILDGEPLPEKPKKPELPTRMAPSPASDGSRSSDADAFDVPPPRASQPSYRRPQSRRTSGTLEMMQGLLIGSMMSSSGGGRRRSAPSLSRGVGRMRGGGRRRG